MNGPNNPQKNVSWIGIAVSLILICVVLPGCLIGCGGAALVVAVVAAQGDSASPAEKIGEEQYWGSLADFIAQHPERFVDTDHVFKLAEELKALGKISSTDRLSSYKARMQSINESNRNDVVRTVRGGGP